MYLGIMDGIRGLYYKADLRMAEKKADRVFERESKKMDQELAELRELVQYPDETIRWLQLCSINRAVDNEKGSWRISSRNWIYWIESTSKILDFG